MTKAELTALMSIMTHEEQKKLMNNILSSREWSYQLSLFKRVVFHRPSGFVPTELIRWDRSFEGEEYWRNIHIRYLQALEEQ